MAMKREPLCIYVKDICMITNLSERTCQRLMNDIRFFFNKKRHQFVTIREFCEYAGFDYEELMDKFFR